MKAMILVLDALGIGEMDDANYLRNKRMNTLESIHSCFPLDKLNISSFNLSKEIVSFSKPKFINKVTTKECHLGYIGADSNLGHQNIIGTIPQVNFEFVSEIKELIFDSLKKTHILEYLDEYEIIRIDKSIYISNNMECDTGLNINVIGMLDCTTFEEIMIIGKKIRRILRCSRVIVMGGVNFTELDLLSSLEHNYHNNCMFKGINIPKLNIYNSDYKVVHLSFKNNQVSLLDNIEIANLPLTLIGKTADLFPGYTAKYLPMVNTDNVLKLAKEVWCKQKNGLVFVNVQEIDLAGHSQDVEKAYFTLLKADSYIPEFIESMGEEDIIIITADHGNGVCQYSCRIFIFHLSKSRTSLWSVGLVIQ